MFGYLGEIAAFATAISWALSSQLHASATMLIGVPAVTMIRLPYKIFLLLIAFFILRPANVFNPEIAAYLILSALFGTAICETLFYKAVQMIGPRLSVLVQSLSACITAVMAYAVFGESIGLGGSLGIGVAIFGVFFVLADGGKLVTLKNENTGKSDLLRGAGLALLSAVMLSISLILLKKALQQGSSPLFAGIVRLFFGGIFLMIFYGARGQLFSIWLSFKNAPAAWNYIIIGGVFSALGVWLSGVAVLHTATGIANTITSLEPVMIIPVNAIFEKKLPSLRSVLGTLIAFAGVALLIFSKSP